MSLRLHVCLKTWTSVHQAFVYVKTRFHFTSFSSIALLWGPHGGDGNQADAMSCLGWTHEARGQLSTGQQYVPYVYVLLIGSLLSILSARELEIGRWMDGIGV